MHIAFVASECVPFSKTGGLADVVGALPKALAALGHQVSIYVPYYRQTKLTDPKIVLKSITVPFDDKYRFASVVTTDSSAAVRFYFVDYPQFFDREALYGTSAGDYPDNAERFYLFTRAVLEASKILGVPHVFHCHDWQSALLPVMLRTLYSEDPAFRDGRIDTGFLDREGARFVSDTCEMPEFVRRVATLPDRPQMSTAFAQATAAIKWDPWG